MVDISIDTLKYFKRYEQAGFTPEQVKSFVLSQKEMLEEAFSHPVKELTSLYDELSQNQQQHKTRLDSYHEDIKELKTDMKIVKADIVGLKADVATLKTDMQNQKNEIHEIKSDIRLMKWMLALIVVATVIPQLKLLLGY